MLSAATPPPNDNIQNAAWVQSSFEVLANGSTIAVSADSTYAFKDPTLYRFLEFDAVGTNVDATMQASEPSHGSHETGSSVWWKWVSPVNATIELSTEGSDFDTTVAVYIPVPWNGVTVANQFGVALVGEGDDVKWNEILQTRVNFPAYSGNTYLIAVGGFRQSQGQIILKGTVLLSIPVRPRIVVVDMPRMSLERVGVSINSTVNYYDKFTMIVLSCNNPGCQVFYTLDGTLPSVHHTDMQGFLPQDSTMLYQNPIEMGNFMVRAIAVKYGWQNSPVMSSMLFQLQVSSPVIMPNGGTFDEEVIVYLETASDQQGEERAVIHYTLDGQEPSLNSSLYAGKLILRNMSNVIIRVKAWIPGHWVPVGNPKWVTRWIPGYYPSETVTSLPFTVRPKVPQPFVQIRGEQEPVVLKGGNPLQKNGTYSKTATIELQTLEVGASLQYLRKTVSGTETWMVYSVPLILSKGKYRYFFKASKTGMVDSEIVEREFEVIPAINIVNPNLPIISSVQLNEYQYYSFTLTEPGSDVIVQSINYIGVVDVFVTARQLRPTLKNTSFCAMLDHVADGVASINTLTVLHTNKNVGIDVIVDRNSSCPLCPFSTPLVVGVRGASSLTSQFSLRFTIDTTPIISLSNLFRYTINYREWKYLKFYLDPDLVQDTWSFNVSVQSGIKNILSLRVSIRQGEKPTGSSQDELTTSLGGSDGLFVLQGSNVKVRTELWYVGVQFIVRFDTSSSVQFTLQIVPIDANLPALKAFQDSFVQLQAKNLQNAQEIFPNQQVSGLVKVAGFAFFKVYIPTSQSTLSISLREVDGFTDGLRVFVQKSTLPTLMDFIDENITSYLASNILSLALPVGSFVDYYIGVYGFSYNKTGWPTPTYNFQLNVSISQGPSNAPKPFITPISANYRFFYAVAEPNTYLYFSLMFTDANSDLHIALRKSVGDSSIFVSTTNPYPGRDRREVGWYSDWRNDGGMSVDVFSFDPGFRRGMFYVSVFAHSYLDIGIAAFSDKTPMAMEIGRTTRATVNTYTYFYYRYEISEAYVNLSFIATEETSGRYMTVLVMRGKIPTTTENIFESSVPGVDGSITFFLDKPLPGRYIVMVHFYKLGYAGPVLSHSYTLTARTDFVSSSSVRDIPTAFQVKEYKPWQTLGLPTPPSWDLERPQTQISFLNLGTPVEVIFTGEAWVYYNLYVDSFASKLYVSAQPNVFGLAAQLYIQYKTRPTQTLFLRRSITPDATGTYRLQIDNPTTKDVYIVGVLFNASRQPDVQLILWADISPGAHVYPNVTTLQNYLISFSVQPALSYRYYKIPLPANQMDISIQVTHLSGNTDILMSNVNPWPTRANYNQSALGWWRSEVQVGGGSELSVRTYQEGYMINTTYYISVYTPVSSTYYILARLDFPPPTIGIGTTFRGNVAVFAFATYRFFPEERILNNLVFIVKLQTPFTTGLTVYMKISKVPPLLRSSLPRIPCSSCSTPTLFTYRPR
eukprot:768551-Hanusia_phi.AAC.2